MQRHRLNTAASLLLAASLTTACTPLQVQQSRLHDHDSVMLTGVPFYPQEDHQCGPAALATVLQFSGLQISPQALTDSVYTPGRQGSFAAELMAASRQHQRLPYIIEPQLSALLATLAHGLPVLVLQNNGLSWYPVWHYAVVTGYDRQHDQLIMNSGRSQNLRISLSVFERTWARSQHWGMVVLDPATLPDWLKPEPVLQQLSIMEKKGAGAAALAGYQQAVQHWPQDARFRLGLANSAVRLGDNMLAKQAFEQLLEKFPDYGPGLNNYADFLRQQGKPALALPYARRAVEVMDTAVTRQTLQEIEQQLVY